MVVLAQELGPVVVALSAADEQRRVQVAVGAVGARGEAEPESNGGTIYIFSIEVIGGCRRYVGYIRMAFASL